MPRLIFEKRKDSVWISHLDLMRLFQRAFQRAGLQLKHTQGFNPRPFVSIALPLSVGVESCCELLDFELESCELPLDAIRERLNMVLVDGIKVISVYEQGRNVRDLSLLDCSVFLTYDNGIPSELPERLESLFASSKLVLPKKTKNGIQDQDIIPMIKRIYIESVDNNILSLRAVICCQNPTLNPAQIAAAVITFLPEYQPNHVQYRRNEIFDSQEIVFR